MSDEIAAPPVYWHPSDSGCEGRGSEGCLMELCENDIEFDFVELQIKVFDGLLTSKLLFFNLRVILGTITTTS